MNFQDIILKLNEFWAHKGCLILQPYDIEVGAGTFHPATFLRVLGPEHWKVAYVEPSRRPTDGRYGKNPNRLQHYYQYQVILKPSPLQSQELYLESLCSLGLDPTKHDIRFVEDDWESPTLGAWGLGWEVWLDGMEITQFTYFQQVGGIDLKPVSVEITYGLERIAMYLQEVDNVFDIIWTQKISYGEIHHKAEVEFSKFNFDIADIKLLRKWFDDFEKESKRLIKEDLVLPAYEFCLRCSHTFNLLDARGAFSVTERTGYIARVRKLAKSVAEAYLKQRQKMGFPLLKNQKQNKYKLKAKEKHISTIPTEIDSDDMLLVEIGTEEIPARFLPCLIKQIKEKTKDKFQKKGINYTNIEVFATPRRILLKVDQVAKTLQKKIKKIYGPPRHIAFDSKGNPTKAAKGFAISQGVDVSMLKVEKIDKGEYVFIEIEEGGGNVTLVLPDILKEIILSLNTPKTMRWADGTIKFVRPIHWILAMLGNKVIQFSIDGINTGHTSRGHRFLAPEPFTIKNVKDYFVEIKNRYVVFDQKERYNVIWDTVEKLAKEVGGIPIKDEELLNNVTFLVEYPNAVLCCFPEEYLKLPKELLITVMKDHQKYFAIENSKGKLLNKFIVISNTVKNNNVQVRKGAERVIKARFEDARFYYVEDLKRPLIDRVEELKGVIYHEKLGSIYDKIHRLKAIVMDLCKIEPKEKEKLKRAAILSKADLVTGVVKEFPELQGIMGKHYAIFAGEDTEVAEAIYEHYLPTYTGDKIPTTHTGAILSIADKIDTIVSFFSIGLKPTGSEDPFALRRAAMGIISILINKGYELSLDEIILSAIKEIKKSDNLKLKEEVEIFFLQRLEPYFLSEGYPYDILQAVFAAFLVIPLKKVKKILDALVKFKNNQKYNSLVIALKRVYNILKNVKAKIKVDETLFLQPQEKILYQVSKEVAFKIKNLLKQQEYLSCLEELTNLIDPINQFFDNVLVMDKEEKVKNNRLAILENICDMLKEIADFSKLIEKTSQ